MIAHLCWLKYSKAALLSIPIASYWSIERLSLIYFPYAQQDHKLNENGIIKFIPTLSLVINPIRALFILPPAKK
ncbi:hypothetical protein [Colwellia sp. TT2012]|uniref:hypothetical protein n=1 Tax=Colwellia sp. TT2012 TaxID=1720342 RepID=UPI00070E18F2|nr:hypothetical protein [Colwellia sp. TT2012]